MQTRKLTQQTHEAKELFVELHEEELDSIVGGFGWPPVPLPDIGKAKDFITKTVGKIVDNAPPGPVANAAKAYKASALHNEEGHWWSFL